MLFKIDSSQHGAGPVLFRWHPDGTYLATVGSSKVVHIFDRYGAVVDDIPLSSLGACLALEWDKDGERLAIMLLGVGTVLLWEQHTRKVTELETNMKDLTFMRWSVVGPQLAIGTAKGNLLIFNPQTSKKYPTLQKHHKKINCGAWSTDNRLALGSEDKMVSISNAEGEPIGEQMMLQIEPISMEFADVKGDDRSSHRKDIISVITKKGLTLVTPGEQPHDVSLPTKFGELQNSQWFGDGYVFCGFNCGWVSVISTHARELGEQLFEAQLHAHTVTDTALCPALNRAAAAGDNCVKIVDLENYQEIKGEMLQLEAPADKLNWTKDGHVLSVSTKAGEVLSYLARIPVLNAHWETKLVHLCSLREVSVVDAVGDAASVTIPVAMEPTFLALGPQHVAVGMNNRCWFYPIGGSAGQVAEREYIGTVADVRLNTNFAAALSDGVVQLHRIEDKEQQFKVFPDKDGGEHDITCIAMTNDFLIYGSSQGSLVYWLLSTTSAGSVVNEFRHPVGIRKAFPNPAGTRCIIVDDAHSAHVINPVNDQSIEIPDFPGSADYVLWDSADPGVFVVADARTFSTYMYCPASIDGPTVEMIGNTKRPVGFSPIICFGGIVTCQSSSGSLFRIVLSTHSCVGESLQSEAKEKLEARFNQDLAIGRLKDAWEVASGFNNKAMWKQLSKAALRVLEVELAIRAETKVQDAGMVLALQQILPIEDNNLLAGHIHVFLSTPETQGYDRAQDLFLASSRPVTALEMRRDLMHWDAALKLAQTLSPADIPFICREYAHQLEFQGDTSLALQMYERSLEADAAGGALPAEHVEQANAGLARMALRSGDLTRGLKLAANSGSTQVCRDCAAILEGMKQLHDAALLYEKGENLEKAALIHIQNKNFSQAAPLMSKIQSPKLHLQYAKAKEAQKAYAEAAASYEKAKDMDSVVRIQLEHLSNPQAAFAVVRKTRTAIGAEMVATFCKQNGDYAAAIEFLLMAKQNANAMEMAQAHDMMEVFGNALGDEGTPDEYAAIAAYYEQRGNAEMAGRFHAKTGQHSRALHFFLQCGERCIDEAIDVAGKARNETLTHKLIDFLMGEDDAVPKDPKYIFRLYMALGNFPQAAGTAVIIARQEQELGNYKVAHQMLLDTFKDLSAQNIAIPQELKRGLQLLHSYVLAKVLVRQGDHMGGARMLIRVAKNISKFPSHIVPILTSTVIECQRAGLKRSAFEYASQLMHPEYRANIAAAYKKKIEAIVRKPDKSEEEEQLSPCPYCKTKIPTTQLDCPSCKNTIPYCIATGAHMIFSDWCVCPSCRFPALYSAFVKHIETEKTCPMCAQEIVPSAIQKVEDPAKMLQQAVEKHEPILPN